jgi:hypothetical protein
MTHYKVKITKCPDPTFWYKDKIGKTYVVKESRRIDDAWALVHDKKSPYRYIAIGDAEMLEGYNVPPRKRKKQAA